MLAYSSVVQAGFMMFALFSIIEYLKNALCFYTLSYGLACIVLFYALTRTMNHNHKGFTGLAKNSPVLAAACSIALFSLAGIPFTSGFLGKFFILSSAMEDQKNLLLVILALVLVVVCIYYYFKVIIVIYFKNTKNRIKIKFSNIIKYIMLH